MIVSTLLRNELLKARKRRSVWVALAVFLFMNVVGWGGSWYEASRNPQATFALPDSWPRIFGDMSIVGILFGSVLIMLLIASEFSWRTARQNVIDGLTKEQFFLAKVMVVPIVVLMMMAVVVMTGGTFALIGTDFGASTGPLMGGPQFSFLLGWFTASVGYGALALLCATSIRSSGAAIAVWFLYIGPGEGLVNELRRLGDWAATLTRYLPTDVFNRVMEYRHHDPALFQRLVESALEDQRPPPEAINLGFNYGIALMWVALFLFGAFVWFRKRDL